MSFNEGANRILTASIILHEKHIERKTGKALSFSEVG